MGTPRRGQRLRPLITKAAAVEHTAAARQADRTDRPDRRNPPLDPPERPAA